MCTHQRRAHIYALLGRFKSILPVLCLQEQCFIAFVCMNPQNPYPHKTIIRSQPTSSASWWQAYVFDPCGTYMPFINTCLLEERCTAAASWWGKPGAGSACVTGRLLFPFHRWLISLWRLGTARAECMRFFLRSLPLAALWLPDKKAFRIPAERDVQRVNAAGWGSVCGAFSAIV